MGFRLRFVGCLLAILAFSVHGFGQSTDNAELELNEALVQYAERLNDLSRSRGLDVRVLSNLSGDNDDSRLLNGARPIGQGTNISRLDISSALSNYPDRSAVIFYSYLGDSLRIWLIDKDRIVVFQQSETSRSELNYAIARLRSSLRVNELQLDRAPHLRSSKRAPGRRRSRTSLRRNTNSLTRILLPPTISSELKGVRHLIVAPVLSIGTVPFAMLTPFGDQTCLIENMSVSIVPSVYDVLNHVESWKSDFSSPLVVGNPYFPPDKKWVVPQLPGAEDEARYVGRAVHTKALIGKNATKDEITQRASNADFLYFATHGIASSSDPLAGGFLLLSAKRLTHGWWTAREIQDSKLRARLAVLSACQTGLGRVHDAGVIGLSRAFQIAGVPRVAMSLWSVDDKATSQLMKVFVDRLQDNVPSEALRLAMLDLKKSQPNPSKWAAFVLFGTPR